MAIVNWDEAPEWAVFYANDLWWMQDEYGWNYWCIGWVSSSDGHYKNSPYAYSEYFERPQQWPEESRIDIIATNGNDGMHYDEQREQHEQAQPAAPQANKYDRTILGKYGSGKCVVDVYRVLNAFPSGSPEIDHAIKKLLAPGKRGVKSELQDLREAIQSIEARIDYLSELGEK
jgi:hypothetical protein